jgi:hypothetical protein
MTDELKEVTVSVRTHAEGLLSRLAHDLELRARATQASFDGHKATLAFRVGDLRVQGVLKHGRVDSNVLSQSDVRDIEERILGSLKAKADDKVTVELEVDGAALRGHITAPCGHTSMRLSTTESAAPNEGRVIKANGTLSIAALGAGAVKGPMGSFRLADTVEIEGTCVLPRATATQ